MSFQEEAIAGFGREICTTMKYYHGAVPISKHRCGHHHSTWVEQAACERSNTASTGIAVGSDKPALSASDNSTVTEAGSQPNH